MKKLFLGLCGASLVVSVLYLGFVGYLKPDSLQVQLPLSWMIFLVSFLLTALIGLPLHFLLQRLKFTQWWAYSAVSLIACTILLWVSSGLGNPITGWAFYAGFALPIAFIAAMGGIAFWAVVVRKSAMLS